MLSIGSISMTSPFVLAPLAGYSDLPFRLLCRKYGAGLAVSEMISSHGLVYGQSKTLAMLASCPEEKPVSFQLFGADPVIMGEAAAILGSHKPDLIDINMGCPVKKVTKRGAGAALMTNMVLAEQIVKAVVSNSGCPVTIKIRSGPDRQHLCAKEFALMAEGNGIAAICVHGRTWSQGFTGTADWSIVKDLKQAVSIPVLGNGDIASRFQAEEKIEDTGCDGILIGRGVIGNPWVFSESGRPEHIRAIIETVHQHLALIEEHVSRPEHCLGSIRNHLGKYFKGLPGSSRVRKQIYDARDFSALKSLLDALD